MPNGPWLSAAAHQMRCHPGFDALELAAQARARGPRARYYSNVAASLVAASVAVMEVKMSTGGSEFRDEFGGREPADDTDEFGGPEPASDTDQFGGPEPASDTDQFGGPEPTDDTDQFGGPEPADDTDQFGGPEPAD